ncbi:unnamed protein product [Cercospora beticola]|nr:unnamed protein product [Cercospora beticola]
MENIGEEDPFHVYHASICTSKGQIHHHTVIYIRKSEKAPTGHRYHIKKPVHGDAGTVEFETTPCYNPKRSPGFVSEAYVGGILGKHLKELRNICQRTIRDVEVVRMDDGSHAWAESVIKPAIQQRLCRQEGQKAELLSE